MGEKVKVSAVVPVYNGSRFIGRCIGSILPQLTPDCELIVVDDASTDGTFELLCSLFRDEPKLILIRRTVNGGPAAARNMGIRVSRGEYVGFCDADDEWGENHLSEALGYLEANPDKQAVFTNGSTENEGTGERAEKLALYAESDKIHLRTMLCRREVFDMAGLLDESLRLREDTEWIVRARKAGVRSGYLGEESYIRHIRDDGLSAAADEEGRAERMVQAMLKGIRRGTAARNGQEAAGTSAGSGTEVPGAAGSSAGSGLAAPGFTCDVSILIPMYNAEKYIAEAVNSCRSDRYSVELIIVDDGSKDRSRDVLLPLLEECAGRGTAAIVMARKHKGQASSRNDALHLAGGRHILFLDADDRFVPGAVDIMADACAGAREGEGPVLVSALCRDFISPELTEEEAASLKINPGPYRRMLSGCMFASRALYDRIGEFNEEMPTSETAEWVMRMRDAGIRIVEIDDIVLARRYHKTNLGRTNRKAQMESYLALVRGRLKARQAGNGAGQPPEQSS